MHKPTEIFKLVNNTSILPEIQTFISKEECVENLTKQISVLKEEYKCLLYIVQQNSFGKITYIHHFVDGNFISSPYNQTEYLESIAKPSTKCNTNNNDVKIPIMTMKEYESQQTNTNDSETEQIPTMTIRKQESQKSVINNNNNETPMLKNVTPIVTDDEALEKQKRKNLEYELKMLEKQEQELQQMLKLNRFNSIKKLHIDYTQYLKFITSDGLNEKSAKMAYPVVSLFLEKDGNKELLDELIKINIDNLFISENEYIGEDVLNLCKEYDKIMKKPKKNFDHKWDCFEEDVGYSRHMGKTVKIDDNVISNLVKE